MKTLFSIILSGILTLGAIGIPEEIQASQPEKWELLGSRKVDFKLDRDVIHVGAYEGTFTKLRVKVKGGAVNMHKMVVEYGNGSKDEIPLKHNFHPGDDTRVIDLRAGKRVIRKITFWYDTQSRSNYKARVLVFGRH